MVEDVEKSLVNNHTTNKIVTKNGTTATSKNDVNLDEFLPPDGGIRAWLVMMASFFCNGILFGVINSYSVLYAEFYDNLQKKNVINPSGKAALIGSLTMGTTFFISPISGVLTDFIGLRTTTFLGGALAASGMFISSFCVDNIIALYITYGIMYGLGGALAYTPSLAVLGHYFKKYLGIVNGVVTTGSAIFTIAMPYIIDCLLKTFGIVWTLRILALITSTIIGFAFLFKPVRTVHKQQTFFDALNVKVLLKNRKYVIWTLSIAISLFGYFVPYVYMLKFVQSNFSSDLDGKLPVLCIGITSGIGRLIFGYLADFPKINPILLQQLAFFTIGLLTMLLPVSSGYFTWLLIITLGMGLVDGCFISVLGPIAFDICGQNGAAQAIGFLLGICSIPLTIGPYIAGIIYEQEKSYTLPLVLAGIPPIIGSIVMFLIRFIKTKEPSSGLREMKDFNDEELVRSLSNCEKSTDQQQQNNLSECMDHPEDSPL